MKKDYEILRELAKQIAEISALPLQEEKRALWRSLNSLNPKRPMIMIDQVCWSEMNVDDELTLQCEDKFCRNFENDLRIKLYQWKHFPVDKPVEPYILLHKNIQGTHFPIDVKEIIAETDPKSSVRSHLYEDQFKTEEDLERIFIPPLVYNEEETLSRFEKTNDIFGGILEVVLQGATPVNNVWDLISSWKGVESALYDIIDRPEFIHKMVCKMTNEYHKALDNLSAKNLLGPMQFDIHCTGAYSSELPKMNNKNETPQPKNMWTYGLAQMFSTVSPQMHDEFEIEYFKSWAARFGLVYYGCCDPLDGKIDILRKIPNLRKISMSPWVNEARGAEALGRDFVYSRKPNPAFLAWTDFDDDIIRKDLKATIDTCKKFGCPCELILKDISTVNYRPERLWRWAEIATELVSA